MTLKVAENVLRRAGSWGMLVYAGVSQRTFSLDCLQSISKGR